MLCLNVPDPFAVAVLLAKEISTLIDITDCRSLWLSPPTLSPQAARGRPLYYSYNVYILYNCAPMGTTRP